MTKTFYASILCGSVMLAQTADAQNTYKTSAAVHNAVATNATKDVPAEFERHISVSLGLGTTGVGVEGKMGLNEHFNVRLGVSTLPLGYTGPLTLDEVKTSAKASGSFSKVSLLAEYKPFRSSIRLVGGLAYYFDAAPHVALKPTQNYKFGNTTVTAAQLGTMDIKTDFGGLAPYLGIGLLPDFPKRKFNVNVDLGVYYLSKEHSTFTGTGMLEDNKANEAILDDNLSGYRWFPELKVNLTYKIN